MPGMFENPYTSLGLGLLAANTGGRNFSEILGRGGMLGMQNYQLGQSHAAEMAKAKQAAALQAQQLEAARRANEQAAMRSQNQSQVQALMGRAPEAMGPPTAQGQMETQPGTGVLGGRISPQQYYAQLSQIPGYQSAGITGMSGLMGAGETADFGKTPVYYNDADGNLRMGQLNDAGQFKTVKLPEGAMPVKPMSYQNIGGQVLAMPYGGGRPVNVFQKTLPPQDQPAIKGLQAEASASGTTKGKAAAEAQIELPGAEIDTQRILGDIESLRKHPGLDISTGWTSALPALPGTEAADFQARREQLQGGAFLQGFQMLKGGGTVTEIEGEKAEKALARMETAVSKPAFLTAMKDYEKAVINGLKKLKLKAGPIQAEGATEADKDAGDVIDWADLPEERSGLRGRNRPR